MLAVLKNAKNSEINAAPLCLGNFSKEFSVNNMKKTGLYGYVYDMSSLCLCIDVDEKTLYNTIKK